MKSKTKTTDYLVVATEKGFDMPIWQGRVRARSMRDALDKTQAILWVDLGADLDFDATTVEVY